MTTDTKTINELIKDYHLILLLVQKVEAVCNTERTEKATAELKTAREAIISHVAALVKERDALLAVAKAAQAVCKRNEFGTVDMLDLEDALAALGSTINV